MSIKIKGLIKTLRDLEKLVVDGDPHTLSQPGLLAFRLKEAADALEEQQSDLEALRRLGDDHG